MSILQRILLALVLPGLAFVAVGCDSEDEDDPDPLDTVLVEDVPADPATGRDPNTGAPTGTTGRYTFFDLSSNSIILDRDEDDRSDSTSTGWDIAFQSSNIIVNSSATGGGEGGVQILDMAFADVDSAPESGYSTERVGLETSSSLAWGTYNPASMLVLPLENKTLVIRTADGNFAKIRIISYYQGAPEVPDLASPSRYYTFEYVYQPDGSRDFPQ